MLYIYVEEIFNMQSKPGSNNVIFLNYDGEIITGNQHPIFGNSISNYFGWVWYANQTDVDGTPVTEENRVFSIKVPPADPRIDRLNIFKQLVNKYDIFDVNVTDERGVYNSASGFKTMVLMAYRPSTQEYNALRIANNKSENGPWPYSYRRLLRYFEITELGYRHYPMYNNLGLAAPPHGFSILFGGWTQYLFVWTNSFGVRDNSYDNKNLDTVVNEFLVPTPIIARTIAHEVGHKFGLIHDGKLPNVDYYQGHGEWVPIMGTDDRIPKALAQWSKSEYRGAAHVYPGIRNPSALFFGALQNDLVIIGSDLGFIKSPKESISKTEVRAKDYEKYETRANQNLCWEYMENLGVYTRVLNQSDVISFNGIKVIEGMIGFPGDFEILKILLPKGTYQFTIDPVFRNPESMLDIDMSILNCHCHRPKEKYPVNCNSEDLPTRYPTDLSSENFQCISFDNCLEESKYDNFLITTPDSNGFTGLTMTLTLSYTQIVYLLIAGDKQTPIPDGWSVYSSVGKYYLEIVKDGVNNPDVFLQQPSTAPLPVCNCEEFETCNGKVLLFTQENGEDVGTGNTAGAHIREYQVVVNGQLQTKKFLVYGPPVDLNTNCPDGKFCLPVYDPIGQACVKQEFVVGGSWEQSKL